MPFNPRSLENVKCRWATDTSGPTKLSTFRIESEIIEWLNTLEGSKGFHVRTALKEYKRRMDNVENEN